MDLIAVGLLCVCQVIGMFWATFMLKRYLDRKQLDIETRISEELSLLVAGKPCKSGAVLNAIGDTVGREAGRSAKAALMADLAHAQRNVNSAKAEGQLSLVSEASPALGHVLSGMGPNRLGAMMKNPLVSLIVGAMSGRGASGNHSGSQQPPRSTSL